MPASLRCVSAIRRARSAPLCLSLSLLCLLAATDARRAAPATGFTICTTVMNEVDYMPEWIEFYGLQNVTKIVIGDHSSRDSLARLPLLYARTRPGGTPVVEVLPNPGEQTPFLARCARANARTSAWIGFLDNDEFAWSPRHGSLLAYLNSLPPHVSQVEMPDLRFGVGDWKTRPRLGISLGGRVVTPRNGSVALVLEGHTRRAPCMRLGEDVALEAVCGSTTVDGGGASSAPPPQFDFCAAAWREDLKLGKSFVRGYAFGSLGHPHYAQVRKGISTREGDADAVRINHYWVRASRDAYVKAAQWRKRDPVAWVEDARALALQHAVADDGILRYLPALKARLRALGVPGD